MTNDFICKNSQIINASNIHKILAMASPKRKYPPSFLNDVPEPLKITQQGGCVQGSLLYTKEEIEMLLQLMEQCLPVGTQEIGYILKLNLLSLTLDPLWDINSTWKNFKMLVMKKIPTCNPTCPLFVQHAKKIFNALVDKCNISSHERICNLADNNAMLDAVEKKQK